MIVLVTGGRNYNDIDTVLDAIHIINSDIPIEAIVHGGASGADSLADKVAEEMGIDRIVFPANWKKHGKSAGPIRNRQMIDRIPVDLVLAFPGGNGTANMIKTATEQGIAVMHAIDLQKTKA